MSFLEVQFFEEQTADHDSSKLYFCKILLPNILDNFQCNQRNSLKICSMRAHSWFTFVILLCNPRFTVIIIHWCHSTGIPLVLLFISSVFQTPKSCWFKRPNTREGLLLCTLEWKCCKSLIVEDQVLTVLLWQVMLALCSFLVAWR